MCSDDCYGKRHSGGEEEEVNIYFYDRFYDNEGIGSARAPPENMPKLVIKSDLVSLNHRRTLLHSRLAFFDNFFSFIYVTTFSNINKLELEMKSRKQKAKRKVGKIETTTRSL